jgi:hypothetical protein
MTTVPDAIPVTAPPGETVALALLAVQVPPLTRSVRLMTEPTLTPEEPVIVPAEEAPTLIVVIVVALPQLFVTV